MVEPYWKPVLNYPLCCTKVGHKLIQHTAFVRHPKPACNLPQKMHASVDHWGVLYQNFYFKTGQKLKENNSRAPNHQNMSQYERMIFKWRWCNNEQYIIFRSSSMLPQSILFSSPFILNLLCTFLNLSNYHSAGKRHTLLQSSTLSQDVHSVYFNKSLPELYKFDPFKI